MVEPTESDRKVIYPEDDAEGVLAKLFVLPLLSALLRCFCCTHSAPAPVPAPPPVLGLKPECPGDCRLHPDEPISPCCFPSRWRSRQPFPEPQAAGLFFPAGLSGLGEPSGEWTLLLLLLCSDNRLST